jgi:CHAT domain-containing protein
VEIEKVAAVVPESTILLGTEASEEELSVLAESGTLREFDIIHVATHALVDDEWPEQSALVLSRVGLPDPVEAIIAGTPVYDGLISMKEVLRGWELDAGLVTLSGCHTGLGREVEGEGYVGLAHAFFQAGARSLLVSLWRVDDEATALIMSRFYENLMGAYEEDRGGGIGEPFSKAEALREAKRWLRTYTDEDGNLPFQHPAYWSGFILIGQPD